MQQEKFQSLELFLKASKDLIFQPLKFPKLPLNFILGNGTADLDSCVGSILLAYHLHQQNNNRFYIPLINHPLQGFKSRFEVVDTLGPLLNELIYKDIFFTQKDEIFKHFTEVSFTLFDHNIPESNWEWAKDRIQFIIDHHADKTESYYTQKLRKNIQHVGSATTLVGDMISQHNGFISDDIKILICKTILVDTFNFDQKQKNSRWVDFDYQIFQYFKKTINFNKDLIYEEINNLKYSKQLNLQLTFEEALFKDYKEFQYSGGRCAYSVIFIELKDFLERHGLNIFELKLTQIAVERSLDVQVLMSVHPDKQQILKREFIVLSKSNEVIQKIKQRLFDELQLELEVLQLNCEVYSSLYVRDIKSQYTRKTIEPILSKII